MALPASFGLLVNLTSVDLKHNRLAEFPLPLLALEALQELDLSDNALPLLWTPEWRPRLKEAMATVGRPKRSADADDDDVTPDQSLEADFHSLFPSSPRKPRTVAVVAPDGETLALRQALPSLRKLALARNRLSAAILNEPLLVLPSMLTHLDLTGNPLVQPLDLSASLGRLPALRGLALADCGLGDTVFALSSTSPDQCLSSLALLDLTRNGMDSLGKLESVMKQVSPATSLAYTGAPPTLRRLIPQASGEGASELACIVTVADNFLRDEARRRRTMLAASNANAKPSAAGSPVPAESIKETDPADDLSKQMETLAWEVQLTEGEKRRQRAAEARAKAAEPGEPHVGAMVPCNTDSTHQKQTLGLQQLQ